MLDFPVWKRIWVWALTLIVAACSLPTLVTQLGGTWPSQLPGPQVNLGLDLAGGSQLLLEAQPADVAKQRLETMEETVRTAMRSAKPRIQIGDLSTAGGRISFLLEDASQVDAAREALLPALNGTGTVAEWDLQVVDGSRLVLTQTQKGLDDAIGRAMDSATEVVRKRIDAIGTREPTIVREGPRRIMVQVPGLQNPQQLKDLLGKTAELEFKLVDTNALQSDIAQGIVPPGDEIVPYAPGTPGAGTSIAVKRLGGIRGDTLTDARQTNEPQTNEPVVSIQFNGQGADKFGRLTTENVNKPFAIILDGQVLSAPNINEPILGGRAQITGNFTVQSAHDLAVSLASGKLPVKLNVIEERTVGPDLGKDSIHKGVIASAIGMVGIIIFMLVTYGRFGVYANIALIVNAFLILGIMAVFNATLTLPGIAGFILTIGAAVDANVLINERIREEIRRGRRLIDAVETGYHEAFRAIFDANVTHVVSAAIMAYFGSGPVRGFAVVLLIGVVTSVFTAVYFTRMLVALWIRRARPRALHI
jgi:preprotein translocase subunit SecD